MQTQLLKYSNGKKNFIGYLAYDDKRQGPRPGIVVYPEAFGLGEHARSKANRLAEAGYVALAADLHGDGVVHKDLQSVMPAIQALYTDRVAWRSMASAALDALLAQPNVDRKRIGAIGFCFGGTTCLEIARASPLVGVISTFHAGLNVGLPEDAGKIRAKVLINHGADDPLVQKDAIDAFMAEMRRDKVDWNMTFYGNTVHSFTEPAADARGQLASFRYNKNVDERSWAAMQYLFNEAFGAS
jgi:dienelactone hydrolase